ncbi:hypothetical protein FB45DRAFT_1114064 [Roridomyces roridus]|uniref:Uncharacterized protein n=1 Tax=Roridomyces roridus TaxID=1738132 RepID=A0AAD7FU90_9AGAR|nr:hypothetical protein FB45DRAFT_1114064 [Roridomyces roridus]
MSTHSRHSLPPHRDNEDKDKKNQASTPDPEDDDEVSPETIAMLEEALAKAKEKAARVVAAKKAKEERLAAEREAEERRQAELAVEAERRKRLVNEVAWRRELHHELWEEAEGLALERHAPRHQPPNPHDLMTPGSVKLPLHFFIDLAFFAKIGQDHVIHEDKDRQPSTPGLDDYAGIEWDEEEEKKGEEEVEPELEVENMPEEEVVVVDEDEDDAKPLSWRKKPRKGKGKARTKTPEEVDSVAGDDEENDACDNCRRLGAVCVNSGGVKARACDLCRQKRVTCRRTDGPPPPPPKRGKKQNVTIRKPRTSPFVPSTLVSVTPKRGRAQSSSISVSPPPVPVKRPRLARRVVEDDNDLMDFGDEPTLDTVGLQSDISGPAGARITQFIISHVARSIVHRGDGMADGINCGMQAISAGPVQYQLVIILAWHWSGHQKMMMRSKL